MGRLGAERFANGQPRRRTRRVLARLLAFALATLLCVGPTACARYATGHYHTVQRGENLYRIGLRYGVEAQTLARVNGIRDVSGLRVGQKIWIPKSARTSAVQRPVQKPTGRSTARVRPTMREEARREGRLSFIWPVQGAAVTSRFGRRRGRPHEGIDIGARAGTRIRAAEAGKVIHSGWLGDYGKVVIVKHAGHYRSVYAHARKLYVRRGQFVDRGQLLAEVGTTGNATGPHLHFEIRRRESPRDPMLYLP